MNSSTSIKELAGSLCKAQGEIRNAEKDRLNPHFKSHYADLASIWEACREPLTKHGLSVVQLPRTDDKSVTVETILMHESGEWVSGELSAQVGSIQPQAVGSVITYLRRYALAAISGVAPGDDDAEAGDGNGAQGRPAKAAAKPSQKDYGTNGTHAHDPGDGPRLVPDPPPRTSNPAPGSEMAPSAVYKAKISNARTRAAITLAKKYINEDENLDQNDKAGLIALADAKDSEFIGAP